MIDYRRVYDLHGILCVRNSGTSLGKDVALMIDAKYSDRRFAAMPEIKKDSGFLNDKEVSLYRLGDKIVYPKSLDIMAVRVHWETRSHQHQLIEFNYGLYADGFSKESTYSFSVDLATVRGFKEAEEKGYVDMHDVLVGSEVTMLYRGRSENGELRRW